LLIGTVVGLVTPGVPTPVFPEQFFGLPVRVDIERRFESFFSEQFVEVYVSVARIDTSDLYFTIGHQVVILDRDCEVLDLVDSRLAAPVRKYVRPRYSPSGYW
jgi:hypothetical protein